MSELSNLANATLCVTLLGQDGQGVEYQWLGNIDVLGHQVAVLRDFDDQTISFSRYHCSEDDVESFLPLFPHEENFLAACRFTFLQHVNAGEEDNAG